MQYVLGHFDGPVFLKYSSKTHTIFTHDTSIICLWLSLYFFPKILVIFYLQNVFQRPVYIAGGFIVLELAFRIVTLAKRSFLSSPFIENTGMKRNTMGNDTFNHYLTETLKKK